MKPQINFSGFLHQAVLFSFNDLKQVLQLLSPIDFYNVSAVQTKDMDGVTHDLFLSFYKKYLENLFNETTLDLVSIASMFSHALATDGGFFSKIDLSNQRFLLKPKRSVIQLQPLGLFVSSLDGEIHTKTFAKDAQSFGIKWSFPTLYEETMPHKLHELTPDDVEYHKFNLLRRFIRSHTEPLIVYNRTEKKVYPLRYSKDLKVQIGNMSFFKQHGLDFII